MSQIDMLLAKLERANKHISDLEPEWRSFSSGGAYSILFKDDTDKRERSYYLAVAKDIPQIIPLIAGDALQNLRSVLDHLAYHLVAVGTGQQGPFPRTYFPICESATEYKSESPRKVKGMRQDAIDAIDAIEPYRGGAGHILWQLHRLNNIDKHRLLLTVYGQLSSHRLLPSQRMQMVERYLIGNPSGTPRDLSRVNIMPSRGVFRLKEGDVLLTVPTSELEDYMNFVLDVSFGEPQIVQGDSVSTTLQRMAQFVETILRQADSLGLLA